jgi:hypothetical protein
VTRLDHLGFEVIFTVRIAVGTYKRRSWVEAAVQICETKDADTPKADASDGSGG